MQKRIYISGKITGLNFQSVIEKFILAQTTVMAQYNDAIVENPIAITAHLPENSAWETYMRECVKVLSQCTHIYMLPCWKNSNGAKMELKMAIDLGIEIIFEK